jgi:hypothetical protein
MKDLGCSGKPRWCAHTIRHVLIQLLLCLDVFEELHKASRILKGLPLEVLRLRSGLLLVIGDGLGRTKSSAILRDKSLFVLVFTNECQRDMNRRKRSAGFNHYIGVLCRWVRTRSIASQNSDHNLESRMVSKRTSVAICRIERLLVVRNERTIHRSGRQSG